MKYKKEFDIYERAGIKQSTNQELSFDVLIMFC